MAARKKTIAVVGDVTVDWMFINPGGGPAGIEYPEIWGGGFECRAAAQPGGAALLAGLTETLLAADPPPAAGFRVAGPAVPAQALASPAYAGLNRTWTSWALHPRSLGEKKAFAWRMVGFWGQTLSRGRRRSRAPVPGGRAASGRARHRRLRPGFPHGRRGVVAAPRCERPARRDRAQDDGAAHRGPALAAPQRGLRRCADRRGPRQRPAQGERPGRDAPDVGADGTRDRRRRPLDRPR